VSNTARAAATSRSALYTNVQPWPIESAIRTNDDTVDLVLEEGIALDGQHQHISLKRNGDSWTIAVLQP
jgi:hypothetical protein